MRPRTAWTESTPISARVIAFLGIALLEAAASTAWAQAPTTKRISVNSQGAQSNGWNVAPTLSADGRYVAYESFATNLALPDNDSILDVFLHDHATGQTELLSVDSFGVKGNGESSGPSISSDGRFVAFHSKATNLVPGDTNGAIDVFLRDRSSGTTIRASVDAYGNQANGGSAGASLSLDGRMVAFLSNATNLVQGDTNGVTDVFVRDMVTGKVVRANVDSNGNQATSHSFSQEASISGDGRFVAFSSSAENLVPGDPDTKLDIFVHDLLTVHTEMVNVNSAGVKANDLGGEPKVSGDGRFVAFWSHATNLVPNDTNFEQDIFVRDRVTSQTRLATVNSLGQQANRGGYWPSMSPDGYVAFGSDSTNLVLHTFNGGFDCYVHDLATEETWIVSVDSGGNPGNFDSVRPEVSAGARTVAFNSVSTSLVPGHTATSYPHNYVHDRFGCPYPEVYCQPSQTSLPSCKLKLSFVHAPLVSSPEHFTIKTFAPGGDNVGLCLVGASGPASVPVGTQGGTLCVAAPYWRTATARSEGLPNVCDGMYTFALSDFAAASPLVVAGNVLFVQVWARDHGSPDGFALSDAVRLTVCP